MRAIAFGLIVLALLAGVTAAAAQNPLPKAVMDAGLKKANCDAPAGEAGVVGAQNLGKGRKLVQVLCWTAAYQAGSIFFALDPSAPDKAQLLSFKEWSRKGLKPTHSLTDPTYDEKKQIMRMRHKGRGIGDCGTSGQWQWTGSAFKLTGYWNKDKCDGKEFTESRKWRVYPPRR